MKPAVTPRNCRWREGQAAHTLYELEQSKSLSLMQGGVRRLHSPRCVGAWKEVVVAERG